jgi:hypothetical protein
MRGLEIRLKSSKFPTKSLPAFMKLIHEVNAMLLGVCRTVAHSVSARWLPNKAISHV